MQLELFQRNGVKKLENKIHIYELDCYKNATEEQKKRMDKLSEKKDTRWRVSEEDVWQNKHYKRCLKIFDNFNTVF